MSDARPGYARFDGTETPEQIEEKIKVAFSPVRTMLEALQQAERQARVRLYRNYPPRDERGRYVKWPT